MRLRIFALACIFVLTIACSGEGDKPPTPTLFPQLEASPGPTAVPPPLPTRLPTLTDVPAVIWLIDVAAGRVATLDADAQHSVAPAWFDEATGTVVYQPFRDTQSVSIRTALDGARIEQVDYIQPPSQGPEQTRWLLERVAAGEIERDGAIYSLSDMWGEDTQTGERTLLASGLWQCTACDAFSAPGWSPSGRYVFYREHGGENRVFLSDLQAASTRDITVDTLDRVPRWSPSTDMLLRPSEDGTTILEDVVAGTQKELPDVPWPASFDPSGAYVYSILGGAETIVASGSNGEVIVRLKGSATYDALLERQRPFPGTGRDAAQPVVGANGSFVAAVGGVADCDGTLLYVGEQPQTCVLGAGNPVISPDGSQVILARKSGETGPVDAPTIQAISLDIFDIIVVVVATGEERILAQGALEGSLPPQVVWNAAGTHVLVRWPYHGDGP